MSYQSLRDLLSRGEPSDREAWEQLICRLRDAHREEVLAAEQTPDHKAAVLHEGRVEGLERALLMVWSALDIPLDQVAAAEMAEVQHWQERHPAGAA